MLTSSYWNHNGTHQHLIKQLEQLVPKEGEVPHHRTSNKALEKFRVASNCYYDLYNNGLCNRRQQFSKVFGIRTTLYETSNNRFRDVMYAVTEINMDDIVLAAAKEQNLIKLG